MWRIRRLLGSWWLRFKLRRGWAQRGRTGGVFKAEGVATFHSKLTARHIRDGKVIDERVVDDRVVTTAGVNFLVDAFQNLVEIEAFKYHDSGTGTNAEAVGNTALQTPCGEARDTGTQEEGASANIYKTVATHTYAGAFTITEHGLFSAATVGTLWDRSVFAAINVAASDKIEFSYELSCVAGG